MRSSPKLEGDRQRVDADGRPPCGLIAVAVQVPVVEAANGLCICRSLSAQRPRLGEANVMRFGGRPAADNAWLRSDDLQCSLSRRRMVFAATRRLLTLGLDGKMIGAAVASS